MLKRNLQTLFLSMAILTSAVYSQEKHALLVGVGDHIYPRNTLLGPKNDVPALQKLLIGKYGFRPENIEVLMDTAATRSNIISAFERRLIAPASERDLVLFYFTGHGTQVTDYSGDERDKRDEAFLPYDGKTISTLLIDDHLSELINQIKTPNVVVILDACHSGTGTRGLARPKRVTAKDLGIKTELEPPSFSKAKNNTKETEFGKALVISAARADQVAADYPFLFQPTNITANANMGVLTYYLLQEAWREQDNQLAYGDLIERIRIELENNGFDQTPQLEGESQNMFLDLTVDTTTYSQQSPDTLITLVLDTDAEVIAVHDNQVTIQATDGVQLVKGSIFESVEQTLDNESNVIRILETSIQNAIAEVITGQFEVGDQLIETFHFIPQSKLRLAVVGDSSEIIKEKMQILSFIEVVQDDDFRDVELDIQFSADGIRITPFRNQHRLPDIIISDMDSCVVKTKPLLENLYAVTKLSNLQNPDPPFQIDVRVNGKDYDEIPVGNEVKFTVRSDRDAYLYLVDVDPAGKMTVLFPNMYTDNHFLKAGIEYKMPTPDLYRLQVEGPPGPELVKAIATVKPLNLEVLSSDSGEFNSLNESAVTVTQAIVDQLKEEVNRLNTRGIAVLPSAPSEQPISTEGWTTDEVLIRVVDSK